MFLLDICFPINKYFDNETNSQLFQYFVFRQDQITKLPEKDIFKVVIPKENPNNTQVFDFCFIDKIKDLCTDKIYDKSCSAMQAYNNKKKILY